MKLTDRTGCLSNNRGPTSEKGRNGIIITVFKASRNKIVGCKNTFFFFNRREESFEFLAAKIMLN